jgi:hypothetical protein
MFPRVGGRRDRASSPRDSRAQARIRHPDSSIGTSLLCRYHIESIMRQIGQAAVKTIRTCLNGSDFTCAVVSDQAA